MLFSCLDDYSATAAQMRTTVDPYPAGAESLATTGQGEVERLRYISLHVFGATYWYTAPIENVNFRHRRVEMHMGAITGLQEMFVGAQTWSNAAVRFHGVAFGVADQASHPESVLMRLHVGGNTKFMVSKLGDVHAATLGLHQGGSIANPAIFHQASASTGIWFHTVLQGAALNHMGVSINGTEVARFHANGLVAPQVLFQHAASGRFVGFKAHAGSTSTVLWTLPNADGTSGQFLQTAGNGILAFASSSSLQRIHAFTTTGTHTWTKPSGVTKVVVEVWSGGGGGGGSRSDAGAGSAGGGGGGGYSAKLIDVTAISTVTVTVGAAGTAGTSGNPGTDGGTGGTSSFGAEASVTGGVGGVSSSNAQSGANGGAGGAGSSGNINFTGNGGVGGDSQSGGAGGMAPRGGGGGKGSFNTTGFAGTQPGGGGGGGASGANAGAAGGDGMVVVWEYAG